jgi:hypothetical protein
MSIAAVTKFGREPLAAPFAFRRAQKRGLSFLQQVEKTPKTLCASRQVYADGANNILNNNINNPCRRSGICVAISVAGQSFEGLS